MVFNLRVRKESASVVEAYESTRRRLFFDGCFSYRADRNGVEDEGVFSDSERLGYLACVFADDVETKVVVRVSHLCVRGTVAENVAEPFAYRL